MKNSFLRDKIIKGVVWGVLIPVFLVGCGFEDDLADIGGVGSEEALTYITLNLSAPKGTLSRATDGPTGGETGDGIQKGENYEYLVNSAALFFYQDEDGVNGNASTPVKMVTLGKDSLTNNGADVWWKYDNKVSSVTFSVPAVEYPDGEYHVIVVANPKDLSWATGELTLGEVRDHIEKQAWDEVTEDGVTSYSSFLMTSENDDNTLVLSNNDSELHPATLTVEVERMAAQIAYQASGSFTISSVNGGDEAYEGATVQILGGAIVNNLTSGSYLLKRVSSDVTDRNETPATINNYLGDETANANDIATNYVIDPWTVKKDGSTVATTDESDNLTYVITDGNNNYLTYGEYYPGEAVTEAQKVPSYWANLMTTGKTIKDDYGDEWHSIGYTMENTMYAVNTSKKYATAMVFQAQFTPAAVTSDLYSKTTLSEGETFFKWKDVLYATAEDMMAAAYPSGGDLEFDTEKFAGHITDCTYWSQVKEFAETLRDDDPTGYKAYLLAQVKANENNDVDNQESVDDGDDDTANELTQTEKDALKWETYMSETFGYSLTPGDNDGEYTVAISDEGVKALYEATDYAVQAFKDGQCYYTWWIRHSNDDDEDTNGVMEYGIVRNNTYYLKVKSVYTLGGYIPMEGLQCDVYVIRWSLLDEEVIEM